MSPKDHCELMLDEFLPFAEKMLVEHGEFFPFGGYIRPDGSITHASATDGSDRPPSQELIDLLSEAFTKMAQEGEIIASAIVYDVRIALPDSGEKSDAILAALDHRNDYSVEVIFPYSINSGALEFGQTFAQQGAYQIFINGG